MILGSVLALDTVYSEPFEKTDDGWEIISMQYKDKITVGDDEIYYQRYSYSF